MGVEELTLDWGLFAEDITIVLDQYDGPFPVEFSLLGKDGKSVFSGHFHSASIRIPAAIVPAGTYRYRVRCGKHPIQAGELAVG